MSVGRGDRSVLGCSSRSKPVCAIAGFGGGDFDGMCGLLGAGAGDDGGKGIATI